MNTDDLKSENPADAKYVLPAGVLQVDVNTKWECCKCGWIGAHNESANKTPVVNDAWLLICPKCGNKDEFYACI